MNYIDYDLIIENDEIKKVKKANLDVKTIEKQIKKLKIKDIEPYMNKRSDKVEAISMPPFNISFYDYIYKNYKIPQPKTALRNYFNFFSDKIVELPDVIIYENQVYEKDEFMGRVVRSYSALIRELHFYYLVKERNIFDRVYYSLNEDLTGSDLIIIHNGIKYQVSLFIDSRRSEFYKKGKNLIHDYENQIEIPLNINDQTNLNGILLYNGFHVSKLQREIQKYEKKKMKK